MCNEKRLVICTPTVNDNHIIVFLEALRLSAVLLWLYEERCGRKDLWQGLIDNNINLRTLLQWQDSYGDSHSWRIDVYIREARVKTSRNEPPWQYQLRHRWNKRIRMRKNSQIRWWQNLMERNSLYLSMQARRRQWKQWIKSWKVKTVNSNETEKNWNGINWRLKRTLGILFVRCKLIYWGINIIPFDQHFQ